MRAGPFGSPPPGCPPDFLWWRLSSLAQLRTSALASAARRNEAPPGPPPCVLAALTPGLPRPPTPRPAPGPPEQFPPPPGLAVGPTGNSGVTTQGAHGLTPGPSPGHGAHPAGCSEETWKVRHASRGGRCGQGPRLGLACLVGGDPAGRGDPSGHRGHPCACVTTPPGWRAARALHAWRLPPRPPLAPLLPGDPGAAPFPSSRGIYGTPRRQGQLPAGAIAGAPPAPAPRGEAGRRELF